MTADPHAPPPALAGERVLEYAVLDESVGFSGSTSMFVGGVELGRVPRLAICEDKNGPGVSLFFCDDERSANLQPLRC